MSQRDSTIDALLIQARSHWTARRPLDAEALCRRALALDPTHPEALVALAEMASAAGRHRDTISLLTTLMNASPGDAAARRRLGTALLAQGDYASAVPVLRDAVRHDPSNARGHNNLGEALFASGALEEAAACYACAIECDAGHAGAHNNLGRALQALGRVDEAVEHLRAAVQLAPSLAQPLINLGGAHAWRGEFEAAEECYDRVLRVELRSPEAWLGKAQIAVSLHRLPEALEHVDRALQCRPKFADALLCRGQIQRMSGDTTGARTTLEAAVAAAPRDPHPLNELAMLLGSVGDMEAARASLARLESLDPRHPYVSGYRLFVDLSCANWDGYEERRSSIERGLEQGLRICTPFQAALTLSSAGLQRRCAEIFVQDRYPPGAAPRTRPPISSLRPRIGYLSADFHDYATAHLAAGLFERHDRRRFDVVALSIGEERDDWMHQRLTRAFDRIEPLRHLSDVQCAARIEELGIDILVDLKGHTLDARPGILRLQAAPVQVNYLGFPGTWGAPCVDYVIADPHVIPSADVVHYTENVVHLPYCYQPNDPTQSVEPLTPTRGDCGLPGDGFVYCCFNGVQKLTPAVFAAWMRVLHQVDRSVLWLLTSDPTCIDNLRRHAGRHGIDPARLVFAAPVPHARHLARYRLADLFLDTTPYNAHTTGSDALFAGCPLLTVAGTTFAGRVGASLLHAVGLPELVMSTMEQYEAEAVSLGRSPSTHAALRDRLSSLRHSAALFDAARHTRELESAYEIMWSRCRSGLPAAPFQIAAHG